MSGVVILTIVLQFPPVVALTVIGATADLAAILIVGGWLREPNWTLLRDLVRGTTYLAASSTSHSETFARVTSVHKTWEAAVAELQSDLTDALKRIAAQEKQLRSEIEALRAEVPEILRQKTRASPFVLVLLIGGSLLLSVANVVASS